MNYDTILEELGEFGAWQRRIAMLLWLPGVIDGIQILMFSVTGISPPSYRCQFNECNNDIGTILGEDVNIHPEISSGRLDYCKYYTPIPENGQCTFTKEWFDLSTSRNEIQECARNATFYYPNFEMENTVITEFDLFCKRNYLVPLVNSFFMLGILLGSVIFGVLSDLYGRKNILLAAIVCTSIGSLLGGIMPEYWSYVLCRILVGAGAEGCFLIAFNLSMEMVGVKERVPFLPWVRYRTLVANTYSIPLAAGECIVSATGYIIKKWRILQIVMSVISLSFGFIWCFIPESPRWLICEQRYSETEELIKSAADTNGVNISPTLLRQPRKTESEEDCEVRLINNTKYTIRDLFHPSVRVISLVLFICWPIVTMVYYGISYSSEKIHLTEDVFLSYILVSLIEMPSYIFLVLVLDIWGRKPLLVSFLIIPGISCLAAAFLKKGPVFTCLVLLGKFCISAAFNATYVYTAELYPTSIRNTATGVCSMIARFGGIAAPWITTFLPDQGSIPDWVPYTILGLLCVLGGGLALLLPDTVGFPFPETFADLEVIKANSKPIWKLATLHDIKLKEPSEEEIQLENIVDIQL